MTSFPIICLTRFLRLSFVKCVQTLLRESCPRKILNHRAWKFSCGPHDGPRFPKIHRFYQLSTTPPSDHIIECIYVEDRTVFSRSMRYITWSWGIRSTHVGDSCLIWLKQIISAWPDPTRSVMISHAKGPKENSQHMAMHFGHCFTSYHAVAFASSPSYAWQSTQKRQ